MKRDEFETKLNSICCELSYMMALENIEYHSCLYGFLSTARDSVAYAKHHVVEFQV